MRLVVISGCSLAGALAALLSSGAARAEKPKQDVPALQRDQLGATASAEAGRARARRGDCAGALDAFDAAIRLSIDPTLRRDRGLCHERLGNPYPAIDDFRAYLAASPDAPDADDIRDRLGRLEQQVGVGGPAKKQDDEPKGKAGASASVKVGAGSSKQTYDSATLDADDDSSPLRRGSGWILAPYLGARRWFAANSFAASLWAETVGLRVAYSMNETSSFFGEAGYERFNTTQSDAATVAGLSSQIGYEARFPLSSRSYDDFFILGVGFGYEHLSFAANGINQLTTSSSFGGALARGRLGWRHNFGAKTALEVALDGGGGKFFAYSGGGSGSGTGMLGLNVALLWGM